MKKTIIYLLVISNLLGSCTVNDWLTVQPQQVLSNDEMFQSKQGFYDALYGIYTLSRKNYDHNGGFETTFVEHLALQWRVGSGTPEERMNHHEYTLLDSQMKTVFENQYTAIANINLMLEYLETQKFLTTSEYNALKAECLGLRAWMHFDLIRLWGPIPTRVNATKKYIPYVTKLSYSRNAAITYDEFMTLLQNDMNTAEQFFSDKPEFTEYRLGKWGVLALQARINLWMGKKEKALEYANTIIDFVNNDADETFKFGTLDNIAINDFVFRREHLFGIHANFTTTLFSTSLYNPTAYLDELYEYSGSDIRQKLWVDRSVTGLEEPAKNPLKYSRSEGSVSIVRLSEIYFIAMECGDLAAANTLYEKFTQARGLNFQEITSTSQLNEILFKEYRKEFTAEGVLFYYYKRKEVFNMPRNSEVCTDQCFILPLPQKEINING